MLFLDTESVGLSGPLTTIQVLKDGNYTLFQVWKHTVQETLALIEEILADEKLVIFNAEHEAFIITKWWNVFNLIQDKTQLPDPKEVREIEENLNYSKLLCLRPKSILDLYVVAKQTIMSFAVGKVKRPIEIRKVPSDAATPLKEILENYASKLPQILFAKFKNKMPGDLWEITPHKEKGFVDFKLSFNPSLTLKSIIRFLFPGEERWSLEIPGRYLPNDKKEFKPWNDLWPKVLSYHIKHWESERGQQYASNDVYDLQKLLNFLIETKLVFPDKSHVDSDLAWHVGSVRAIGFCIDNASLDELIDKFQKKLSSIPATSSQKSLAWLREVLTPDKYWLVADTNTKKTLIPLTRMKDEFPELAERAQELIDYRGASKRIDILMKLKEVGRYHPSFEISGTLSGRMSGRGGFNPQGIAKEKEIRSLFLLADEGYFLSGGDFSSQEITILDAVVKDEKLHNLIAKNPKIIHKFMAYCLYGCKRTTENTFEWASEFKDFEPSKEQYYNAKQCVYALVYGSQIDTFTKTSKVSLEQASAGLNKFKKELPGLTAFSDKIFSDFCSMTQPNGIGTQIIWKDPVKVATSIFGFSRSYALENLICKYLFGLAANPPQSIKILKGKVVRRNKEQSIVGATQSAIYATCFAMQADNLRSAGNHYIQSPGATVTKLIQWKLLNLQPIGIDEFKIKLYNVHDELLAVNKDKNLVTEIVQKEVALLRHVIPLLDIDWKDDVSSWGELKD